MLNYRNYRKLNLTAHPSRTPTHVTPPLLCDSTTRTSYNFELLVYGSSHNFAVLVQPSVLLLVYAYYVVSTTVHATPWNPLDYLVKFHPTYVRPKLFYLPFNLSAVSIVKLV
jgi:hypothetical protein